MLVFALNLNLQGKILSFYTKTLNILLQIRLKILNPVSNLKKNGLKFFTFFKYCTLEKTVYTSSDSLYSSAGNGVTFVGGL